MENPFRIKSPKVEPYRRTMEILIRDSNQPLQVYQLTSKQSPIDWDPEIAFDELMAKVEKSLREILGLRA